MISRIILIGNYKPDNQYSMLIFERLTAQGYRNRGVEVSVVRPLEIAGKLSFKKATAVKWLGYIDKFILFPIYLLLLRAFCNLSREKGSYHICDHSNAFYLYFLPKKKTIITCHDVLAIRAGLGYTDTYCYASASGKILQKIILKALSGATKLAAVSEFTLRQLKEIDVKPTVNKTWICIHNALSKKFLPMPADQIKEVLQNFEQIKNKNFILHVGSDLERKNRKLLLYLMYELQNEWDGVLVLAGERLNEESKALIEELNIADRVIQLVNPSDREVIALYSSCYAMIFPSYSEGFGWPIIEAQACGAPVITSNKAPMMNEVGGSAALYADPDNPTTFTDAFLTLKNQNIRAQLIKLGYENCERFNFVHTMTRYIEFITT